MEEAIAKANEISPDGKITYISDRKGFSILKNFNSYVRNLKSKMGPELWDYYLERMHRCYIVNHGTFVAAAL